MRHIITIILAVLAFNGAAQAQTVTNIPVMCVSATDVVDTLKKDFGESLAHHGITKGGGLLNFYIGDKSWTVTLRMSDDPNMECVLTSGEEWQSLPEGKDT